MGPPPPGFRMLYSFPLLSMEDYSNPSLFLLSCLCWTRDKEPRVNVADTVRVAERGQEAPGTEGQRGQVLPPTCAERAPLCQHHLRWCINGVRWQIAWPGKGIPVSLTQMFSLETRLSALMPRGVSPRDTPTLWACVFLSLF